MLYLLDIIRKSKTNHLLVI